MVAVKYFTRSMIYYSSPIKVTYLMLILMPNY